MHAYINVSVTKCPSQINCSVFGHHDIDVWPKKMGVTFDSCIFCKDVKFLFKTGLTNKQGLSYSSRRKKQTRPLTNLAHGELLVM